MSAPAGRYHGLSPFTGLRFFVSFGRTQVQDVSLFGNLDCSNNSAIADTLIVPAATIHTDGSFATSRRDTGIRNGHPTDFTYTFRGNFHSIGPDHSGRAAGTMRESFTFTDTDVTCTSDTQAWAAPRTS